jgi:hypothetical protein
VIEFPVDLDALKIASDRAISGFGEKVKAHFDHLKVLGG